ncbi:MAG: sigma-70 family RNA polymerase sigma factor [Candidatus Eisenbacteria bacterium]|nr:sigma-70 family RNA polymerase sigma factor [Candidatus Latescibacterota bacterium]MBD3302374.1 sigma-70 family RNA polymerase sigma factor [Candidatus Eisenbacteria bacterium]
MVGRDDRSSARDYASLSDEELMEEIVRGAEEAFSALVSRYQGRVINVVSRLISDRDRAQEIAQETFLRVFIHRERYRPSGKFSTWLYTIAMNLAKNEIRRRVRARGMVSLDKLLEATGDSGGFIADAKPGPERLYRRRDVEEKVTKAIDQLPPKFREVIVLRDIQQLSYEEIGDVLKIPGGTVRSRINRARLALKEILDPAIEGTADEL